MEEILLTCDEVVVNTDFVDFNENDKDIREPVSKRDKQLKRWFITLNNPFWDNEHNVEVDVLNTEVPINYNYYNLEFLKSFNNIDLFEFHFVEVTANVEEEKVEEVIVKEINANGEEEYIKRNVVSKVKVNKTFVVERPFFKDYDALKTYVDNLQVNGLKYAVGQIEQGEKEETTHFQGALIFEISKRFFTMKKYFPTAHLEQCKGSNYDVKIYCTKEETRVMQPFTIGEFSEMRSRNDIKEFYSALKGGATNLELMEDFPSIFMNFGVTKINSLRNEFYIAEFSKKCRNIETTFVYGVGGVGKSKRVYKEYGFDNVFRLLNFGQFAFHGYNYEKVIFLDEFSGQIPITRMNKILDVYPYDLEVKNGSVKACYDKVYIASNKNFNELYKEEKEKDIKTYNAFERRIHHIFRVDENGVFHKEKETVFEDLLDSEVEFDGWTKRISKVIYYDSLGVPTLIKEYPRSNMSITELTEEETLKQLGDIF